jgi:Nif-specific regulatory protein
VSETLLESELFGHRRGSFTGATQDQPGLFEAAGGGTILLDEVGEMPLSMQAKMLRVVQEGEIIPVGDTRPRMIDVRIISATNRDLSHAVAAGTFRQDLYYRLTAFPIQLPPLRERTDDIALLVDRILQRAADRHGKRIGGIEPSAMNLLSDFDWPGNVRELENEIERAVALAREGDVIGTAHLSSKLTGPRSAPPPSGQLAPAAHPRPTPARRHEQTETVPPLRQARAVFEADFLRKALDQHDRNVSRTARALGISRVMLQKKMKEYGLR